MAKFEPLADRISFTNSLKPKSFHFKEETLSSKNLDGFN